MDILRLENKKFRFSFSKKMFKFAYFIGILDS